MNKPFITISVSIYNNIKGLEKTIPSILCQDYTNAEIILSDDGSTKYDTLELNKYAEELKKVFADVRININEQNVGTVKHLNKIISMSKGKYFLDISPGDAFADSHTVSDIVDTFERTGRLIVTSRRRDEYDDGHNKVRPRATLGLKLKFFSKQLKSFMLRKRNVISGCGTYYSRELFEKYGTFDEQYRLVEDYPYYVMLLDRKVRFAWLGKVTVSHEMGGVSNGDVHPQVIKDIELLKKNYDIDL